MTPKTEITESEWLAALDTDEVRSYEPPPGSKDIFQIAELWKMSRERARDRMVKMVAEGNATRTKVGAKCYYNLVPHKQKSKC